MGISADLHTRAADSPGLSRKRFGAPTLKGSFGSLEDVSNLSLTENSQQPRTELNDKNVRKDSKYLFNEDDLQVVKKIGQGSGGTVYKVLHKPTGIIMARKIIKLATTDENQKTIEKQVIRELKILRRCNSPFIVTFYGAFMNKTDLSIMMEFMDLGTMENIYLKNGPVLEKAVATISAQILQGLIYLYEHYKIVHRDIKPGNILLSSTGYSKIADFGVSKETDQTLALTFIGTQTFLAPERLREGSPCTPASDVWALCLSMMEIAMAKFPFPIDAMGSAFDIMQFIVQEPSPTLPKSMFSSEFEDFCKACLLKDPKVRPHPQQLMESAFIKKALLEKFDLKIWIGTLKQSKEKAEEDRKLPSI